MKTLLAVKMKVVYADGFRDGATIVRLEAVDGIGPRDRVILDLEGAGESKSLDLASADVGQTCTLILQSDER